MLRRHLGSALRILGFAAVAAPAALVQPSPTERSALEASIRTELAAALDRAGAEVGAIRVVRTPAGTMARAELAVGGLPVEEAQVRLDLLGNGRWRIGPLPPLPPPDRHPSQLRFDPSAAGDAFAQASNGLRGPAARYGAWFRHEGAWVDGAILRLPLRSWQGGPLPGGGESIERGLPVDLELRLHPDGTILEARDLILHARGHARVFDPNPVVVSGRRDLRDGDPVDPYRVWVPIERLDGTGRLSGRHAIVESRARPTAEEQDFRYDYPSADPRFEEAMAYFHVDRARAWIDSLGFGGFFDGPQKITVHAGPTDNSWYSPLTRRIEFGDGGVDDAEDADIILHELGHAIHDAFVSGFSGSDARAISEGFGDYLAATRSGDPCVGDWDATAYSPPCLRRVDSLLRYPEDRTGRAHADGRIWSGALWEVRERLGAAQADPIILEGLARQTPSTDFRDAAVALLDAAAALGSVESIAAVRGVLAARGLAERTGTLELADGEETDIPLDLAWAVRPEARRIRFSSRGGARIDDLSILTLGPDAPGRALIEYEADRSGFSWMWEILSERGQASGRARLGADGSLEMVWTGAPSLWPHGTMGIFSDAVPTASLTPSDLFDRPDLPPSFTVLVGPGGGSLSGGSLRLLLDGLAWRTDRAFAPRGSSEVWLAPIAAPSRGEIRLRLDLPEAASVRLAIVDPSGRRIRLLIDGERLPAGPHAIRWDGRDSAGRSTASGIYWARLETPRGRIGQALVRLSD